MSDKINANQNLLIDSNIIHLAKEVNLISPFDESALSGCSYDLHVGSILRSRNRLTTANLDKGSYYAESGECFTIQTLESINLRDFMAFGVIVNKHSILGKGLFHPSTTVDPGFVGQLSITFFNLGNIKVEIKKGDAICNIYFHPAFPIPNLIYGLTQRPSYKEGDTAYTLTVDNPEIKDQDEYLSKMYGAPISRLYKKIDDLESKLDLKILSKKDAQRKERNDRLFRILTAVFAALFALALGYIKVLIDKSIKNNDKIETPTGKIPTNNSKEGTKQFEPDSSDIQ